VAGLLAPDGSVVYPTEEAIVKGIGDAEKTSSGVLVADPTPEDLTAYPMVKVDYAMVPQTFDSEAKIADVRRVLNYAVDAGQSILPAGYVPLPENLRVETRAVASAVSTPTTTTTSTTSVPTTVLMTVPTVARSSTRSYQAPTVETTTTTTTIPATTTTTSTTTTSTTLPPPITVPAAMASPDLKSDGTTSSLLLGLGGLSGAALLGTAPWQRLRRRREAAESFNNDKVGGDVKNGEDGE
jgi:hypothetical protein